MGKSNPTPYTITKERYQKIFRCEFPGCQKTYKRNDTLRNHVEKDHTSVGIPADIPEEDESDPESDIEQLEYSEDEDEEAEDEEDDDEEQENLRSNIVDVIMADHQHLLDFGNNDWDDNSSEGTPFNNPQTMIMMCLYNGFADLLSRSQLTTVVIERSEMK